MSCQKFRNGIEELETEASPRGAIVEHLASCEACRDFRAGRERLRQLVSGLAKVSAPDDFEFRLRARIARAEASDFARFGWRTFVPGAAWLTLAACAVFALGLFVRFRPTREQNSVTASTARPARAETADHTALSPANRELASVNDATSDTTESPAGTSLSAGATASRARQRRIKVSPRAPAEEIARVEPRRVVTEENNRGVIGMRIYVSSPIPLPVAASERPLEVMFKDMRGASRVVSVDPVTFGARDLAAQRARVANAKYTSNQGVW